MSLPLSPFSARLARRLAVTYCVTGGSSLHSITGLLSPAAWSFLFGAAQFPIALAAPDLERLAGVSAGGALASLLYASAAVAASARVLLLPATKGGGGGPLSPPSGSGEGISSPWHALDAASTILFAFGGHFVLPEIAASLSPLTSSSRSSSSSSSFSSSSSPSPSSSSSVTWLTVECADRAGLLADVAAAIAAQGSNILSYSGERSSSAPSSSNPLGKPQKTFVMKYELELAVPSSAAGPSSSASGQDGSEPEEFDDDDYETPEEREERRAEAARAAVESLCSALEDAPGVLRWAVGCGLPDSPSPLATE